MRRHIARVVLHPGAPGIAYVAVIGNLWDYTGQRGLFKTVDGVSTWQKLTGGLPDDGKTGATDLVMDPTNPDILYAAMYQRLKRPGADQQPLPAGAPGGASLTPPGGVHRSSISRTAWWWKPVG